MSIIRFKLIISILTIYLPNVWAVTHYVKHDATGNGTSWSDATDLQSAINISTTGDKIFVAKGIYTPTDSRTATFQLKSGIKIYGNFTGYVDSKGKDIEDWSEPYTTLSCDIGIPGDSNDNCYHVLTADNVTDVYLKGFNISGGRADGNDVSQQNGGGIYSENSELKLDRVRILDNFAAENGGGMYNNNSNPTLVSVKFSNNMATNGGGLYNDARSTPQIGGVEIIVKKVKFENNISSQNGGGIYNATRSIDTIPSINYVIFTGNTAENGGGIYNDDNSLAILNHALFNDNTATNGGAIYNKNNNLIVNHSTITGNNEGMFNENCSATVNNSIFWNNTQEIVHNDTNVSTVNFSIVQGIDLNPQFIDEFYLGNGSAALDNGDNDTTFIYDLAGNARIVNGNVDIGAYEVQAPVVKSIELADNNPNNATELNFTVTFSDVVSGVTTDDFEVITSGDVVASVSQVDLGNRVYTVKVIITSGNSGTVGLNLLDDDSIKNNYGIALADNIDGKKTGEIYTFDNILPTADIIDIEPIIIEFSEVIQGITIANLSLTHDSNPVSLAMASLDSADNITWKLNGFSATNDGDYTLTIYATDIIDNAGNELADNVEINWQISKLPLTPTDLITDAISATQINLSWNGNNEANFKLERYDGNIISTSSDSYNDTGLSCDTSYTYDIKAVNANGESAPITTTVKTLACPPPDIKPDTRNLTINIAGAGSGRVEGVPNNCVDNCSYNFDIATNIELTPIADANSKFSGWSGHSDCIDGNISLVGNRLCTAYFQLMPAKLTIEVVGQGIVSNSANINCNAECDYTFNNGTEISLIATPIVGWELDTWQCGINGQISLNSDATCQAIFTEIEPLELTVKTTGKGRIIGDDIDCGKNCSGLFATGKEVILTAIPDLGWQFLGWRGHCNVDGHVVMENSNKQCKAIFTAQTVVIEADTVLPAVELAEETIINQPVKDSCENNCEVVSIEANTDKIPDTLTDLTPVSNPNIVPSSDATTVVELDTVINQPVKDSCGNNCEVVPIETVVPIEANTDKTPYNVNNSEITHVLHEDSLNIPANLPDHVLVTGFIKFSRENYTIGEDDKFITITAHRIGGCSGQIKQSYTIQNGTASAEDYLSKRGNLTWNDNDCNNKTFDITILDDSIPEGSETVIISLLGTDNATLTIIDNDKKTEIKPIIPTQNIGTTLDDIDSPVTPELNISGELILNDIWQIEGVVNYDSKKIIVNVSATNEALQNTDINIESENILQKEKLPDSIFAPKPCNALRIDNKGKTTNSCSVFISKMTVDGDLQPSNHTLKNLDAKKVRISSKILVEAQDVGKPAEILLTVKYIKPANEEIKYTRNKRDWQLWDGHVSSLIAAQCHPQLPEIVDFFIFEGDLSSMPGEFIIYTSYRLEDGTIITAEPLHFLVNQEF